jgi:hypothetical protein
MKKMLIAARVLGLMTGCAGFGKWSSGAQNVVDFVCNPTAAEQAEAAKWLTALDSIQAGVSVAFPAVAIMQASAVMTTLKNGGCFVLAEVQSALDLLDSMQTQQAKMLKAVAAPRSMATQFPALTARIQVGK